jgi:NAD(P)-dependent dehydrogenase (short-subunit alcohol dehydrogenase family)
MDDPRSAVIVGAGEGLSASLARLFAARGLKVALAARQTAKLAALCRQTGAEAIACDATDPAEVAALFERTDALFGAPDVVVHNAAYRVRGPLVDLDPAEVRKTLEATAFSAFLVGQAAARRMLQAKRGAILFTGASAGVKGYAQSAPFAMGKFALRGLAESMARELGPRNIHVAHFVIDGGIGSDRRPVPADRPDSLLDPDAIAQTYWHVIGQDRSAWSSEIAVRPWVETF